jgi:hypothetical protein
MGRSKFGWHLIWVGAVLAAGCGTPPRTAEKAQDTGPACEARQRDLSALLARLPERPLSAAMGVELPEARVGEMLGASAVLEISENAASFDGEALAGADASSRAKVLGARLGARKVDGAASANDKSRAVPLYVAVQRQLDVQTLRAYLRVVPEGFAPKLLVRVPAAPADRARAKDDGAAQELARRLLAERDPSVREALAQQGYAEFARCAKVQEAVLNVRGLAADQRWPKLRAGLLAAVPTCACGELDTQSLEPLLLAEQRAGTATLGALPIGFVRDERCGATMPLRSLAKLVSQMESFDEEFAGRWQEDALAFEQVLTEERLLNYFCNALPGETLAALERARATLYWKLAGAEVCEAWRFEPLAPGAPMGTLRRTQPAGGELSFHYWQGAEEIRLYGPLAPGTSSNPTDHRQWECDTNQRLTGVDARSLAFERGRWFYDEATCRSAPASDAFGGCAGDRSARP